MSDLILEKKKKILTGEVVSVKMQKTASVKIKRMYKHKLVGKVMKSEKKYQVHDEKEECKVGDIVEIYEGKPVSKTKYMYLFRIISKQNKK